VGIARLARLADLAHFAPRHCTSLPASPLAPEIIAAPPRHNVRATMQPSCSHTLNSHKYIPDLPNATPR
ncbi:MAG: hypothetical protein ACK6DT_03875, partial [Planctomycetota bacterium]